MVRSAEEYAVLTLKHSVDCDWQIWRVSFERFLQFLKSSQALSPGVALETAAVLQVSPQLSCVQTSCARPLVNHVHQVRHCAKRHFG